MRTLLGGWSEEYQVFAFWDARRHVHFSQKSPSLQIDASTLEDASELGVATQLRPTREGQEVVVAVSPASLLWYLEIGGRLHDAEDDAVNVSLLASGGDEDRNLLDTSQNEAEAARRYNLVEVMRAFREAQFRPRVLQAYRHRCTVCQCDLKLVDAAHIVPVSHPRSNDDVTNGLALCRLHHGAYDSALLGIRPDYRVIVNEVVAARLHEIGLASALARFTADLPEQIHLPVALEARPLPENLRLGMESRRWISGEIAD